MGKIIVKIKTCQSMTISSCIAENKRHLIQELSIVGLYQSRYDNDTIRKMCNSTNEDGTRSGGQLEVLNLVQADIMDKHDGRYAWNHGSFGSSNSLIDCITLREIIFGKSLTHISGKDFNGCISLNKIEIEDNTIYKSINGILYQYATINYLTTPNSTLFHEGEWILVKVPAAIQDPSLIHFEKINRIGANAFTDTSLKSLIMSTIPPICDEGAFSEEDIPNITLYVPESSFYSYWCHQVWGKFNIQIKER